MRAVAEKEDTVVSQLEKTLRSDGSRCAVLGKSGALTYANLDELSARCAGALQNQLENRFAPIAVMMSHDAPLIAAIVGILRSGGFYFVLNRALPPARLREVLEEVRPRALITDAEHVDLIQEATTPEIQFFLFEELLRTAASFSPRPVDGSGPCALFYTSGSAQKPRPLVYTHDGTSQSINNHSRSLQITAADRITLLAPGSAAASVSSIFGALLNGATLCPFHPLREGLHQMRSWINTSQISVYHSVPSLFRRFAETLQAGEILDSVRIVKLGGEPVFPSDVDLFRQHFRSDAILVNGLGLTEANGNVSHFHVKADTAVHSTTVPVGKPLAGIEMTLLDDDGFELTADEIGEIALRGKHVAPGYWTGDEVQQRGPDRNSWFRTGDLGRRDTIGVLEHLGRKDDQIKLRGQWISAAEIEAAFMQIPEVREAAVVTTGEATRKRISAFISTNNGELPPAQIRALLQRRLSVWSLPHDIFQLPQLPILPNGKIDRAALSREVNERSSKRTAKAPFPADALMLQLVRLWQKALETDNIDTATDFFSLGGDSLAAATMLAAVETLFGVNLPVSALLEAPTIEKLGALIRKGGWSESELRLVALQLRGNKPPLYCVPGAGSEALAFRELAVHLGDDQPVFAFQPQGLDGAAPYLDSIEKMASHYLATLRRHQPRGPYHLCGSSLGGVVAFEMACRLAEDPEEVKFLALLDTYGGEYPEVRKDLSVWQKLKVAARSLVPVAQRDNMNLRLLGKGIIDRFRRKIVHLDLRFHFHPRLLPYRLRFLYLQEVCLAARRRYQLRPFPGRIDLFRIEHQPSVELFEQDPFLGWNGMALGGIEVHDLPGYHGQHLRKPNVAILARQLTACLDSRRSG
ncbi:MAG TPA: non-ribosomal peptide synthetase [Chthoniobacterales bacterium]|nr:non-ribosomal peptide synthetase [Chthoniobacterales bacterium]